MDHPPDLVLTGINHGMNVADDILYSGTVAGAMEAAILACAIALSQRHGRDGSIIYPPKIRRGGVSVYYHSRIAPRTVMNVNFQKLILTRSRHQTAHLDRHKLGDVILREMGQDISGLVH